MRVERRYIEQESKRKYRRNRWRLKKHLQELDEKALNAIKRSYMWYMDTWGGTRCPNCGLAVRPHWLTNLSGHLKDGYITAFGVDCSFVKNCKGDKPDWEAKAIEKCLKKGF